VQGVPPSQITPEWIYRSRRSFLKAMGFAGAGALLVACSPAGQQAPSRPPDLEVGAESDELGDPLNDYTAITNYNNFYEFSTSKTDVARLAGDFAMRPWSIEVGGLAAKPGIFDVEDLKARFPQQERVYRLRCVEGWSMVIPWVGFPLASLLQAVEPLPEARYVRFETLLDPERFPGQRDGYFPWPYVEGLRMDEAMHDLTLLATGLYGADLPPQNGGPIRLVVPWKYGFKSIKSILRIDLVAEQPQTFWMKAAPSEYGFFANVNPQVPHPRWSQSSERRIGEAGRRPTLMFNGYEDQVAHLYKGMDLRENF